MVIESLKAAQTALKEAMKDKGLSEASRKALEESDKNLQKLIIKAQEAAKEAYQGEEEGEEEAGKPGEDGDGDGDGDDAMPEPGHSMTKTTTTKIKHDGPKDDGEEEEEEESKKEEKKAAEESRKVHLQTLLKEAAIPQKLWKIDRLMQMSLKEAKDAIAEQKAYIDEAKKAVEETLETVDMGSGEPLHESTGSENGNLNSLFSGCAE